MERGDERRGEEGRGGERVLLVFSAVIYTGKSVTWLDMGGFNLIDIRPAGGMGVLINFRNKCFF